MTVRQRNSESCGESHRRRVVIVGRRMELEALKVVVTVVVVVVVV